MISFLGYGVCDHETGHCECMPGYTGFFCMEPCPTGIVTIVNVCLAIQDFSAWNLVLQV